MQETFEKNVDENVTFEKMRLLTFYGIDWREKTSTKLNNRKKLK